MGKVWLAREVADAAARRCVELLRWDREEQMADAYAAFLEAIGEEILHLFAERVVDAEPTGGEGQP